MTWQPACHASEVANPGDYIVIPWGRDDELAVSNFGGEVIAWDNRCPHRGARVYTETRGNRPPVCGYHGRCAKADQVRAIPSAERRGFIFVATGGQTRLPEIDDWSGYRLHTGWAMTMDCHWTVAVENALDFEHVGAVHGRSLAKLGLKRKDLILDYDDGSSREIFTSAMSGRLKQLRAQAGLTGDVPDYAHSLFFPGACISSTAGLTVSLQHYIERDDGRTHFMHRMYVPDLAGKKREVPRCQLPEVWGRASADWAGVLPNVPRGLHAELAQIASADTSPAAQRHLQKLHEGVSATGQVDPATLRSVWLGGEPDSPRGLLAALTRALVLPSVPSGVSSTLDLSTFYAAAAALNRRVFLEDAAVCALVAPWHHGKLARHEDRIAHFRYHCEEFDPAFK